MHNNSRLKKIGVIFKLETSLLKQKMGHYEFFEDKWEARENDWLLYVKNEILSNSFCYARYTMGAAEGLTNFGFKTVYRV